MRSVTVTALFALRLCEDFFKCFDGRGQPIQTQHAKIFLDGAVHWSPVAKEFRQCPWVLGEVGILAQVVYRPAIHHRGQTVELGELLDRYEARRGDGVYAARVLDQTRLNPERVLPFLTAQIEVAAPALDPAPDLVSNECKAMCQTVLISLRATSS